MSNSNQEIIEAKLATYIDGELDPADRAELEAHLEQNPQYRRLVDELRKGREMLRGLPRETAPTELGEAFTSQLERSVLLAGQTDQEEPRMRIGAFPRILATAAILFLTFGLAVIVYFVLPGRGGHMVALAPAATQPASPHDDIDVSPAPSPITDKTAPEQPNQDLKAVATAAPPTSANQEREKVAAATPLDRAAKGESAAAGASQDAIALKKSNAIRAELALEPGPHETELDQLARDVSADPQVKELLSNRSSDKLRAGSAGESAGRAVVMVVRSNDPEHVKKELYTYFGDHNIDWQPAPAHIELALNSSLAQQSEQLKPSDPESAREAGSLGAEQARTLGEKQKEWKANSAPSSRLGAPAAPASNGPAADAAPHPKPTASPVAKATEPAQVAGKPAAAPAAIVPSPAPPAPPHLSALADTQTSEVKRLATAKQQLAPAQTKAIAIDTLYVARRLSRRQAEELTECLARNGEVRRAGVAHPWAETESINKPDAPAAPSAPGAFAKDDATPAAPVPSEAAKNGAIAANGVPQTPSDIAPQRGQGQAGQAARKDAAGYRGGAQPPAGLATRSADSVVKKGDELRLSYPGENGVADQSETVKVKEDGTIEPQALASAKGKPVQAAGKTVSEIEEELRTSAADTPARTPVQPTRVSRLDSDLDAGRAGGGAGPATFGSSKGAAMHSQAAQAPAEGRQRRSTSAPIPAGADVAVPSTGPAFAAADAENVVDVVIVVQREVPAAPSVPAESATPTTATPAPSTQPIVKPE